MRVGLALLAVLVAAGCVAPAALEPAAIAADLRVELLPEGGFTMEVPVDVHLVGFDAGVGTALAARLEPTPIDHATGGSAVGIPPDPQASLAAASSRAPTQPVARFVLHEADGAMASALLDAARGWEIEPGLYDANAAEDWLAARLLDPTRPDARGTPAFVVLHLGALGDHAWRYTYPNGWLQPIRVFGERLPLTVFDASAREDPYVTGPPRSPEGIAFSTVFGPSPKPRYDWPMEAGGDETVELLAQLLVDAAHYRFLKGPLYPVSTAPCHHVTLVLAVHQTSATEVLPGFKRAHEWVDVEGLASAFRNLTGDDVTVELRTLRLPQDDPGLDAAYRAAGTLVALDVLRWYVGERFEQYASPREGCEPYLSMLLYGDATTQSVFGGMGTYDVERGRRLAISIVNDVSRVRNEYDGPGAEAVTTRTPSNTWDRLNLLYAHETGHVFGQHHPHHLLATDGSLPANNAWQSVWSVMAYQTDDRVIDFGAVDHATWTRARAGYAVRDAMTLGLEATPEFEAALGHLRAQQWTEAHLALEPLLIDAPAQSRMPSFQHAGSHRHAWS